jgi:ectoine hydroxylase-related dioxygenase (phytanoyl-CoA dioxygenase family)
MLPLYVNKGDVICFDTSIIHGSGINYTNEDRVAMCGAIFEKNHTKVEYQIKGNEMRKYFVTKDYWLDGGQAQNLVKYKSEVIKNEFPNPISKNQILQLLKS